MGTGNFHTANAQATYVIDYGNDELAWQDCQETIAEHIIELDSLFEAEDDIKSEQELRSFPTSSVGYWEDSLTFLNLTFDFRVNLFIRSGYYEAACLDYEVEWFIDGAQYDIVDDIIYELSCDPETYDINSGIWAIHQSNLETKLTDLQDTFISHVESILPQVSTPYGVAAQFSNGETIYKEL